MGTKLREAHDSERDLSLFEIESELLDAVATLDEAQQRLLTDIELIEPGALEEAKREAATAELVLRRYLEAQEADAEERTAG